MGKQKRPGRSIAPGRLFVEKERLVGRGGQDWLADVDRAIARVADAVDDVGAELRLMIAQLRPAYASVGDLAAEHSMLLAALRGGDIDRAQAAWTRHFDDAEQFFLSLIQEPTA